MYDNNTVIGESMGLPDVPVDNGTPAADNFPNIAIGGGPAVGSPPVTPYTFTPANGVYDALYYPVFLWAYQNGPHSTGGPWTTLLTEIQQFDLVQDDNSQGCLPGQNVLIASLFPGGATIHVKAGYAQLADNNRRSFGMVRTIDNTTYQGAGNYYPAMSFFNVFVEITLPVVPGTASATSFPTGGAVLTNDVTEPLIIVNNNMTDLPSPSNTLFYTHGGPTTSATLRFKNDNQPYWGAGDVFGTVTLAGHGVFDPCQQSYINWDAFIKAVMGTPGHRAQATPAAGMYPNSNYPWPTCTYSMAQGTNFGGQPWDALTFTNLTTVSAGFLTVSNFQLPIALPTFGNSAIYTNTNSIVTVGWSLSGMTNYHPTTASNVTYQVQIFNTNTPNTNTPNVTTYTLVLQQLNVAGTAFFGNFELRADPNKVSSGALLVDSGGAAPRISSYIDATLDFSQNNGLNWTVADAPVRLSMGNPPCGADLEPLHVYMNGGNTVINWADPNYTLQYTTTLNPPNWIDVVGTPPITMSATGATKWFQLKCN